MQLRTRSRAPKTTSPPAKTTRDTSREHTPPPFAHNTPPSPPTSGPPSPERLETFCSAPNRTSTTTTPTSASTSSKASSTRSKPATTSANVQGLRGARRESGSPHSPPRVNHSRDGAPAGKADIHHNTTLDRLERIMNANDTDVSMAYGSSIPSSETITSSLTRSARPLADVGGGDGRVPAPDAGAMSPYALADIDFTLPDGDFPADIASLLPPSPGLVAAGVADDDGLAGPASVGIGDEMDLSAVDLDPSESIELLDGSVTSPLSLSGLTPAPMALGVGSSSSSLFGGGSNPLSLANMFPNSGVSPLQQYQLLDAKHARRTAAAAAAASDTLGSPRFHAPAGRGGDWRLPTSSSNDTAIVRRYGGAGPSVKVEEIGLDDMDDEKGDDEHSAWDAEMREKVRRHPPKSMDKITDLELAYIDLKDLQTLMEKAGYTEEQVRMTKIRRRKVKNRNSAKGSATKKRSQFNSIAATNRQLMDVVNELQNRNTQLATANNALLEQTEEARRVAAQALMEKQAYEREVQRLTRLLSQLRTVEQPSEPNSSSSSPLPGENLPYTVSSP